VKRPKRAHPQPQRAEGLRFELDKLVEWCNVAERTLPETHFIATRLFDLRGMVQDAVERRRGGQPWPSDLRCL